eukprot:TRINITY_DN1261_c0_g2_i2.p2 TRINITY_DN1261_c0_g2~~TRINITY_DN1261_c0_g2_i2.p2  ORF type:complete len:189 (-),score=30.60 TRINITY_DN1261_c0_g2_i2:439-1005(-)
MRVVTVSSFTRVRFISSVASAAQRGNEMDAAHASTGHSEADEEVRRLMLEPEAVRAEKTRLRMHASEVAPSKETERARWYGGGGGASALFDRREAAAHFAMNRKHFEVDALCSQVAELRTWVPSSSATSSSVGCGSREAEGRGGGVACSKKHAKMEAQARAMRRQGQRRRRGQRRSQRRRREQRRSRS